MRTFCPACDLETKQVVWSCLMFGKQLMYKETPQVHNSVFLANRFADLYSENVKNVKF